MHRWVAQSLYKAFAQAQRETYDDLAETSALKTMLPWLIAHVEETRGEMGDEFWPYGLDRTVRPSRPSCAIRTSRGLRRRLSTGAAVRPESLESFKI